MTGRRHDIRRGRLGQPLIPDEGVARHMRSELGWDTKNNNAVVLWEHLCDEAVRRYWRARITAQEAS